MPVEKRNVSKGEKNSDTTPKKNKSKSGGGQEKVKKKKQATKKEKTPRSISEKLYAFTLSLFDEVDNIQLIIFRVMWGLIMSYECWTFIRNDYYKLNMYYVSPEFAPKYFGFHWVHAWEGDGMYYHIWTMLFAGLGVAFGCMYHLSCTIFFLGFTYLILLDACLYLNHFYLIAVMAFMLILLPAHKRLSVDSFLFPSCYSRTMPICITHLLRLTQVIVYFYAGIAKFNEDWLRGEPVRHWIPPKIMKSYSPSIINTPLAIFFTSEAGVFFIAMGGFVFDLTAGFLLLLPRGIFFYVALVNCIFFHIMNKLLMNIGIFPWVMLASTTLFFEPDWVFNIPGVARFLEPVTKKKFKGPLGFMKKLVLFVILLFVVHQLLTPLRHHLYYDDVVWNEMGHRYSWRMKLRDKDCDVSMLLEDPQHGIIPIRYESFLVGKQARKIKPRPELMIQYAHYIAEKYEARHGVYPKVFADVKCDCNYRFPDNKQPMFVEGVDLAAVDPWDWSNFKNIITPLIPLTEEQKSANYFTWSGISKLLANPLRLAFDPYKDKHQRRPQK